VVVGVARPGGVEKSDGTFGHGDAPVLGCWLWKREAGPSWCRPPGPHTPDQAATSFIHLENTTIIRGSRGAVKRLRFKGTLMNTDTPIFHHRGTENTEDYKRFSVKFRGFRG
jgi:hypothetical protein